MKLYYMKQAALDFFKDNMDSLYTNYFTKRDNKWMEEAYGSNPFEEIKIDFPNFELADIDNNTPGQLEVENCKILYSNMRNLSELQASDERLWAGLCNSVFYDYLKRRWNNYELHSKEKDKGEILTRFYYRGSNIRAGLYSNTLAKCWWIGRATYNADLENHFAALDIIGASDFSTKVRDLFFKYTYSSNKEVLTGILAAMDVFNKKGIKFTTKEVFRPSLKYLNAYGGGILLDSLSSDEVKNIMLTKMVEMYRGQDKVFEYDDLPEEDEDDDLDITDEQEDYVEENDFTIIEMDEMIDDVIEDIPINEEIITVEYGDRVLVRNITLNREPVWYDLPKSKEEFLMLDKLSIEYKVLGREESEQLSHNGKKYIIEKIEKSNNLN